MSSTSAFLREVRLIFIGGMVRCPSGKLFTLAAAVRAHDVAEVEAGEDAELVKRCHKLQLTA